MPYKRCLPWPVQSMMLAELSLFGKDNASLGHVRSDNSLQLLKLYSHLQFVCTLHISTGKFPERKSIQNTYTAWHFPRFTQRNATIAHFKSLISRMDDLKEVMVYRDCNKSVSYSIIQHQYLMITFDSDISSMQHKTPWTPIMLSIISNIHLEPDFIFP